MALAACGKTGDSVMGADPSLISWSQLLAAAAPSMAAKLVHTRCSKPSGMLSGEPSDVVGKVSNVSGEPQLEASGIDATDLEPLRYAAHAYCILPHDILIRASEFRALRQDYIITSFGMPPMHPAAFHGISLRASGFRAL